MKDTLTSIIAAIKILKNEDKDSQALWICQQCPVLLDSNK